MYKHLCTLALLACTSRYLFTKADTPSYDEDALHGKGRVLTAVQQASSRASSNYSRLNFPDFFLIGAMKCGTTSLHKLITEHPEICTDGIKEKHYFDKETYGKKDTQKTYIAEFATCPTTQFTIDSTPRYIQEPMVPIRMREAYTDEAWPTKKFLLILRDPVSRQYSEYQMRLRVCLENGHFVEGEGEAGESEGAEENVSSFDDTVQHAELGSRDRGRRDCRRVSAKYYPGIAWDRFRFDTFAEWVKSDNGKQEISRGEYKKHLNHWVASVNRGQIFIINFQSLISNTTSVMSKAANFLGLKSGWGDVTLPKPKQVKPLSVLDCVTYERLQAFYDMENLGLIDLINNAIDKPPTEPHFPAFSNMRKSCVQPKDMPKDTELLHYYRPTPAPSGLKHTHSPAFKSHCPTVRPSSFKAITVKPPVETSRTVL